MKTFGKCWKWHPLPRTVRYYFDIETMGVYLDQIQDDLQKQIDS